MVATTITAVGVIVSTICLNDIITFTKNALAELMEWKGKDIEFIENYRIQMLAVSLLTICFAVIGLFVDFMARHSRMTGNPMVMGMDSPACFLTVSFLYLTV